MLCKRKDVFYHITAVFNNANLGQYFSIPGIRFFKAEYSEIKKISQDQRE